MSQFDEHLFGRIAVLNGYLTQEQLQECLQLQKSIEASKRQPIGEILRSKGFLNEVQLREILEIRRSKLRKLLRDSKELVKSDKSFGMIAVKKGLLDMDQLESALLEQQRLKLKNFQIRLGEVLVSMEILSIVEVFDILAEQNNRILVCPACDCHYTVIAYSPENRYKCNQCDKYLKTPSFLDTVVTDGMLGGGSS